jgi:hypothetical protein
MTKNEAKKENPLQIFPLPHGERLRLRGKWRFGVISLKDF